MTFMTYLAQQTEVELHDNLDTIRRCFDGLLAEFPLSYGHWKRYADHEVRHGNLERATEVYERGVKAAAYCVELWSFYAAHAVTHWSAHPEKVRAVFERAVDQVGSDYLADKLWDRYIAFETPHADASATPDHGAVGALFARVLRRPLKALDSYWTRLGQLASTWSSNELLDGAAEAALQAELEAGHLEGPFRERAALGSDPIWSHPISLTDKKKDGSVKLKAAIDFVLGRVRDGEFGADLQPAKRWIDNMSAGKVPALTPDGKPSKSKPALDSLNAFSPLSTPCTLDDVPFIADIIMQLKTDGGRLAGGAKRRESKKFQ